MNPGRWNPNTRELNGSKHPSGVGWVGRDVPEGEDTHTRAGDSRCWTAAPNTTQ